MEVEGGERKVGMSNMKAVWIKCVLWMLKIQATYNCRTQRESWSKWLDKCLRLVFSTILSVKYHFLLIEQHSDLVVFKNTLHSINMFSCFCCGLCFRVFAMAYVFMLLLWHMFSCFGYGLCFHVFAMAFFRWLVSPRAARVYHGASVRVYCSVNTRVFHNTTMS